MKVKTHGQLFDHKCQLKDMKLSGFGPKGLRYHCTECGGVLILRLERTQWDEAFGEKPTFKLSKKVLAALEAAGAETIIDETEAEDVSAELEAVTDSNRFVWTPSDDDEDEDED
ncbi:MAG: hypothetical protein AB1758_15210 [Candidatus Eremiobacterota bacterium]